MVRFMLKSKIHRAVVTDADVDYEGSLTVDAGLLEAADILPHEEVHVWNVTRGTRFTTYALAAPPGSGTVCVNGAAAHLAGPGDLVIVASFTPLDDAVARSHRPRVVLVDDRNRVRPTGQEVAGPTPIQPLDVVALTEDLLQQGLHRGQVGTVVELLAPGVFEVEFVDNEGRTYAQLALRGEQLMQLHYQPLSAA